MNTSGKAVKQVYESVTCSMKRFITFIAAAAMLAVSCQKEAPETSNSSVAGKLTATFVQTKVSYAEVGSDLQPAWEIGDKIIGFDDAGTTYTLTVTSVSAETATLSGTVPDGAMHLIYKSGASASDISSKTLAIDYTAQAGDKTIPAVMLADGTVTDGSCNFEFVNAGAIIGISAVKGLSSGSAISKVTVEGENLSAATVALDGSALALGATTKAGDAISTATLSGIATTDADGTLNRTVLIAVPAGAKIAKVSVSGESGTMKIPSTAADREGVDYVTIAGLKWAKWNVGASSQADYGWYFAWAGTKGYVRSENSWLEAMPSALSYSPSSAHVASASEYLYIKEQTFTNTVTGHNFAWPYTPYQTQNTTSYSSVRFTKYLGSASSSYKDASAADADALKAVLDPEDDAAHVNWGGTWRMPTSNEFKALKDAAFFAWDATDKGYYVFSPTSGHAAGTLALSIPGDLNKSGALLFFPAAGFASGSSYSNAGSIGKYWSSTLRSNNPGFAFMAYLYSSSFYPQDNTFYRFEGCTVRPVSD